jgi:citrate/tricarballylate utilization protein
MVGAFAPVFAFAVLALSLSVRRFFRGMHAGPPSAAASGEAVRDALTLKYLDGGQGQGCNEADDAFTLARRRAHHFTFYGFALCFAATCVATLYHYLLGQPAPYGWLSLPKLLGVSGGAAMVFGTVGLWRLNLARHALHGDAAQRPMDRGFIALLFVTAASGLALAAARHTPALALWLSLHLASVMALFITMPYGKFVHGAYRLAALLRWSLEKRTPRQLDPGEG